MSLHGKSYIAGVLGQTGGKTFKAANPSTGEDLEPAFHSASPAEVQQAMDASAAAFAIYRNKPASERAKLLDTIASEIEALGDELLQRAHAETGLPMARLTGERARTTGQLRLFAQLVREGSWVDARIDRALPDRQPLPRPDIRRMLRPLGPVVVFGSGQFPFGVAGAGGGAVGFHRAGPTGGESGRGVAPGDGERERKVPRAEDDDGAERAEHATDVRARKWLAIGERAIDTGVDP